MFMFLSFKKLSTILIFGTIWELARVHCISVLEKDLTITAYEKGKLEKFKENVQAHLPHDYMREDIYLIRWLRARNFNLEEAESMLKRNLDWRKQQKMDTILEEDWAEMKERYKYYTHSIAKDGQPVIYLALGLWDVRRAAISGENEKLSRYLDGAIERCCRMPRQLRADNKTVTQVDFVVDLAGFSLTQHGCLACVPFYIRFVADYENYFPGCASKMIIVNTPAAFELILTAIRPIFSKETKEALEIYGTNRNKWESTLYSLIDKSQLPPEIGGTDFIGYED